MVDLNPIISILTLNVNDWNIPIKGRGYHIGLKKKKQDSTICCPHRAHFKYRHKLVKSKVVGKDKLANTQQNNWVADVLILK